MEKKRIFVFDATISKPSSGEERETYNLIYDRITHIHYCYGDLSGKLTECETIILKPSLDAVYFFLDILSYVRENFDTIVVSNIRSISIVNVYLSFLGEETLDGILDHESVVRNTRYPKSLISNTYILNVYYIHVKRLGPERFNHPGVNTVDTRTGRTVDLRHTSTMASIATLMSDTMSKLIS